MGITGRKRFKEFIKNCKGFKKCAKREEDQTIDQRVIGKQERKHLKKVN